MNGLDEITRSSLKQNGRILLSCLPLFAFWFIALGTSLFRLRAGVYIGTFVLTSFWAATFLVMALASVIAWSYPGPGRIAYLVIQFAILLLALLYNSAYTIRIKRRRALAGLR